MPATAASLLALTCLLATSLASADGLATKPQSLTDMPERRVTIAKSDSDYVSFPDVCVTQSGRLICTYRVADKHVATRSRTEVKTSDDNGKTWSEPFVLDDKRGHCPRLSVMENGEVILITDSSRVGGAVFRSKDEGLTWSEPTQTGMRHGIPDRPLRIGESSLLTAGHRHVGKARNPLLGQATSAQVMYRSDDMGKTWREWAPLAIDSGLVLCEVSMLKMPDGSLRAFLRENAGVQEPTYVMESFDEGASWSHPEPNPTMGHRPCAGLLKSGKTLVTFRHVGPNGGNRAWLGDPDAERFFAPSAFDIGNGAKLTADCLVIENDEGDANAVMYSLKPLTDPRYATARLEARCAVTNAEPRQCGVRLGCQWRIMPDRVIADVPGVDPVSVDATVMHTYAFTYDGGVVGLEIDGQKRCEFSLAERGLKIDIARRPVRFGNVPVGDPRYGPFHFAENAGRSQWESVEFSIDERRFGSTRWSWSPADGLPNQYEVDRVLELHNDRNSSPGDFGYSGWVQLPDGDVFCVSHYKGEHEYSYVEGYWIKESDFGG